jgi:putative membrane protein
MFGPWGMGWGMWIWVFLIFGLGYWFFWYGPRGYQRRRYESREAPLEVAKVRLAKGEITLEEFEKIKKAIQNS